MLLPDSNKLHALVSSTDESKIGVDSYTAIPLRRWTHVAVVLRYTQLTIFINGVKDSEVRNPLSSIGVTCVHVYCLTGIDLW